MSNKILNWWNNLPFCQRKKRQWWEKTVKERGSLKALNFPSDIFKVVGEEFQESDWVYSPNDRCERFICWFFHYFTERCTVLERTPIFTPSSSPVGAGGSHPDGNVTGYKVKADDGKIHNNIYQSNLSY